MVTQKTHEVGPGAAAQRAKLTEVGKWQRGASGGRREKELKSGGGWGYGGPNFLLQKKKKSRKYRRTNPKGLFTHKEKGKNWNRETLRAQFGVTQRTV